MATKKTTASTEVSNKPVLVLGWGKDGCKDVDEIHGSLGPKANTQIVERFSSSWQRG